MLTNLRSKTPRTALFLLVLTGLYLWIELAFNARLLDVVGGTATPDEVEHIEHWGRLISGFAAALLLLGARLQSEARDNVEDPNAFTRTQRSVGFWRMVWTLTMCTGIMAGVYYGQRLFIDVLVENSSGEHRQRAVILVPISQLLTHENLGLAGFDLKPSDLQKPEGKAFIATFALQALSDPSILKKLAGNTHAIFQLFAQKLRGSDDGFYKAYVESQKEIKGLFDTSYSEASRELNKALSATNIAKRQQEAWADYELKLSRQRRNMRPDNIHRSLWPTVRHELYKSGVPIHNDWHPNDRKGFDAAVASQMRRDLLKAFHQEARQKMKIRNDLDPNLDFNEFVRHGAIQEKWKSTLRVDNATSDLKPNMSQAVFTSTIFDKVVTRDVRILEQSRLATAKEYKSQSPYKSIGKESYRALIVPPIALAFSLLGSLTHIFKLFMFGVKVFFRVPLPIYAGAFLIYLGLMVYIPVHSADNKITSQVLFKTFATKTRDGLGGHYGDFMAGAIKWTIQFQPHFYPINEWLRVYTLAGITFGYAGSNTKELLFNHPQERSL